MRAYERLLKYVKIHTTSDNSTGTSPSTMRQFDLARILVDEMKELGIEDAHVDENCYVYGSIPASLGYEKCKQIGFISHMDTAPDYCGENVCPLIHENYDGKEIFLKDGHVLSPDKFPDLNEMKGKTLITSDGSTLLGADDKAGVAEIMTMAEEILREGSPHGRISIAFTPDEEIGNGARDMDLESFGADFAFTVDGGPVRELCYENFNAAAAEFTVRGICVHPGEAKNRMVNASLLATEIVSLIPPAERPEHTEGREGYYCLMSLEGNLGTAKAKFIIRDHDSGLFEAKIHTLKMIEKNLNEKYGRGTVNLSIREEYKNMIEKIRPNMHLIEHAREAVRLAGMEPAEIAIRGGTDGAQLSFRGLPCPNLGTGGYAFHGPYEHIAAEDMDDTVRVLKGIIAGYAKTEEEV
ncbi:MAG: peptidase T [Eubacterium sp.]|nr:peptidase T [Eubacterium sp.]